MKEKKLLDDLWALVGSPYLSDMRYRPWRQITQIHIAEIEETLYSLDEWNDAVYYLTENKIPFTDTAAAKEYLVNIK